MGVDSIEVRDTPVDLTPKLEELSSKLDSIQTDIGLVKTELAEIKENTKKEIG